MVLRSHGLKVSWSRPKSGSLDLHSDSCLQMPPNGIIENLYNERNQKLEQW